MSTEEVKGKKELVVEELDHTAQRVLAAELSLPLKTVTKAIMRVREINQPNRKGIMTIGTFMNVKEWVKLFFIPGLNAPEWALASQIKWMKAVPAKDLAIALSNIEDYEDFLHRVQEGLEYLKKQKGKPSTSES